MTKRKADARPDALLAAIQTGETELESLGWQLAAPDLYQDVERLRELGYLGPSGRGS